MNRRIGTRSSTHIAQRAPRSRPRTVIRERSAVAAQRSTVSTGLSVTNQIKNLGSALAKTPVIYLPVAQAVSYPAGRALMEGIHTKSVLPVDSFDTALMAISQSAAVMNASFTEFFAQDFQASLVLSAWYLFSFYGVRGSLGWDVPKADDKQLQDKTPLETFGTMAVMGGAMGVGGHQIQSNQNALTDYSVAHPYRWAGEARALGQNVLPSIFQPALGALPETSGEMNSLLGLFGSGVLFFGVYNLTHGVAQQDMLAFMMGNALLLGTLNNHLITKLFSESLSKKALAEQMMSFLLCMGIGAMSTSYFTTEQKFTADSMIRLAFIATFSFFISKTKSSTSANTDTPASNPDITSSREPAIAAK